MNPTLIIGAASVFSSLINLAMLGVFAAMILTVVRRHRPDAVPLLLGGIAFEAVLTCLSYVISVVLPRIIGLSGYVEAQALNLFVFSLAHAAARGLLLWGILRLARPAHEG